MQLDLQAHKAFKAYQVQKGHRAYRDPSEIQDQPGCRGPKESLDLLDQSVPLGYAVYKVPPGRWDPPVFPDRLALLDQPVIRVPQGHRGPRGLLALPDQLDPLGYAAYKALQVPWDPPVFPDRLGLLDQPAAWVPLDRRGPKELQAPLGQWGQLGYAVYKVPLDQPDQSVQPARAVLQGQQAFRGFKGSLGQKAHKE